MAATLDQEAQRKLAESRAQSDTKAIKKAIKDFYSLLNPAITGEHLQAAHANFLVGLDQLEQQLAKTQRIEHVTNWEVQGYHDEAAAIEQHSTETRQKLVTLGDRLVAAQQERARRIEYDGLAKTIAKLPDRHKGVESHSKLVADIDLLRQEEQTYAETWKTRKLAFDAIVSSLEVMQEAIRDEKAEQDRRRALDEDDADADADAEEALAVAASLDPHAKPFVPSGSAENKDGAGEAGATEDAAMEGVELEEGEEGEAPATPAPQATAGGSPSDEREEGEMDTQ
ncbi:hypothetical protein JCM5296_006597 [Sporobolomyces johnsonii]